MTRKITWADRDPQPTDEPNRQGNNAGLYQPTYGQGDSIKEPSQEALPEEFGALVALVGPELGVTIRDERRRIRSNRCANGPNVDELSLL